MVRLAIGTAAPMKALLEFLLQLLFAKKQPLRVVPPLDIAGRIVCAMRNAGYRVDTGAGQVNIVYIEGMGPDGVKNDDAPNQFNNARFLIRFEQDVPRIIGAWEATTEPGTYWTENCMNPAGAARIVHGQYAAWQVGMHRGDHEALVQTGGPVIVNRDENEDYQREGDGTQTGWFGINQHWGYDLPKGDIGSASAGCLVGRTREGHRAFMRLVKTDPRYLADNRFVFTATILPASAA